MWLSLKVSDALDAIVTINVCEGLDWQLGNWADKPARKQTSKQTNKQ